jgi:DNA-binding GntR family transcriptional regulator
MTTINANHSGHALSRGPVGHQIATMIAREILSGDLAAGTPLNQNELGVRFDTSRMPVRDALAELVGAGYLIRGRGNQLRVAVFTPEDVKDTMALQATLNGLISRRATERGSDDEFDELERLHHMMLNAASRDDGATMSELNHQFHTMIYRMSRAVRLVAFHQSVTLHIAWRFYQEHPELSDACNAQHAEIIEAMRCRDAEKVELLMVHHTELSFYIKADRQVVPLRSRDEETKLSPVVEPTRNSLV